MSLVSILKKGLATGMLASTLFLGSCKDSDTLGFDERESPAERNYCPYFLGYNGGVSTFSVNEEDYYSNITIAKDYEGDPIIFSLTQNPGWLSISKRETYPHSPQSARVEGQVPLVQSDTSFTYTVKITDGKSNCKGELRHYQIDVKNIEEKIYVLNSNQLSDISHIWENNITFSSPQDFSQGDVIVAGISDNTPYGILYEIKSVSADKKSFETDFGTLPQILPDTFLVYGETLSPQNSSFTGLEGVLRSQSSEHKFGFSLNNVILYDADGNINTTHDQVIANGNISFDASPIINIRTKEGKLKNFSFLNNISEKTELNVGSNVTGLAQTRTVNIAESYLNPVAISIAPPVIIVPKISVGVNLNTTNINPLSVNLDQEANMNSYVIYEEGDFKADADLSNSFDFSVPGFSGELGLSVSAGPKLELLLYGVSGPFVSASSGLRFEAEDGAWELYGGLNASVGVSMQVFKKGVSAFAKQVIGYEELLAEGENENDSENGQIIFLSERPNRDIYLMNPDGSNQRRLTNDTFFEYTPSWSPDGKQILYSLKTSDQNAANIWIMNSDGSDKNQLTNNINDEFFPIFSRDEEYIAFLASYLGNNPQLYLMNSDGTDSFRVLSYNDVFFSHLSWSSKDILAFSANFNKNFDIYDMGSNEFGLVRLTSSSFRDEDPCFSPDGNKIAFISNRTGNYDIWIMNSDGSDKFNLSNTSSINEKWPTWSPDGRYIAYSAIPVGGNYLSSEIWVIDVNENNKKRLTNNNYFDASPAWH